MKDMFALSISHRSRNDCHFHLCIRLLFIILEKKKASPDTSLHLGTLLKISTLYLVLKWLLLRSHRAERLTPNRLVTFALYNWVTYGPYAIH